MTERWSSHCLPVCSLQKEAEKQLAMKATYYAMRLPFSIPLPFIKFHEEDYHLS